MSISCFERLPASFLGGSSSRASAYFFINWGEGRREEEEEKEEGRARMLNRERQKLVYYTLGVDLMLNRCPCIHRR